MLISSDRLPKSFKDRANQKVAKLSGSLLGAVTPERQATLPKEFELSPHTLYKRFGSTHYGVMIPDLPEPFRYLSWASVLGYVGFTITDTNYQMSKDGKGIRLLWYMEQHYRQRLRPTEHFQSKMISSLTKRLSLLILTIRVSCMRMAMDLY